MAKTYRWTVDVEYDWGGRTNGIKGLQEGLPKIISAFKERKIRGLFFISTELEDAYPGIINYIRISGQEVGSHGHFHKVYKEGFRRQADKDLSLKYFGETALYRAPKFSHITEDIYSNQKGHVGLLKYMWFKSKISDRDILYLHPFDIVEWDRLPNLFCNLWYSRPKKAYDTFTRLLNGYPSSYIDEG